MYRSLGVHVGRRVQVDNFHIVEHDCVAIEDDCVLGSAISMHCSGAEGAREPIRLRRGANLLDHCCVQPGVTVGERAVLGSTTIAPRGACFAPESISTGAVGGRPVRLRFQARTSHALPTLLAEMHFQLPAGLLGGVIRAAGGGVGGASPPERCGLLFKKQSSFSTWALSPHIRNRGIACHVSECYDFALSLFSEGGKNGRPALGVPGGE